MLGTARVRRPMVWRPMRRGAKIRRGLVGSRLVGSRLVGVVRSCRCLAAVIRLALTSISVPGALFFRRRRYARRALRAPAPDWAGVTGAVSPGQASLEDLEPPLHRGHIDGFCCSHERGVVRSLVLIQRLLAHGPSERPSGARRDRRRRPQSAPMIMVSRACALRSRCGRSWLRANGTRWATRRAGAGGDVRHNMGRAR